MLVLDSECQRERVPQRLSGAARGAVDSASSVARGQTTWSDRLIVVVVIHAYACCQSGVLFRVPRVGGSDSRRTRDGRRQ